MKVLCYEIPISTWRRCAWCSMKGYCKNDKDDEVDRDSDHCRHLVNHVIKGLPCFEENP
jgi:hypothetical protein